MYFLQTCQNTTEELLSKINTYIEIQNFSQNTTANNSFWTEQIGA
jgi:hypothetical protein